MLLEHLGQADAAGLLMRAVERVALDGPHTPDLGGTATTHDVGSAMVAAIRNV